MLHEAPINAPPPAPRPFDAAVRDCHHELNFLEQLYTDACSALEPVTLPLPPQDGKGEAGCAKLAPLRCNAVAEVVELSGRINALTNKFAQLIARVGV